MKILICVPGSWKHGLDSPERGESRWAQNIARLLGKTNKYEVYAASLGDPTVGEGRVAPGVRLIHHSQIKDHGTYDLYFGVGYDQPLAVSKKYLYICWGLEDRVKYTRLPKNHYLLYPHYHLQSTFVNTANCNNDKTFFMPTPFCEVLSPPAFSKNGLLWPTKDPTLVSPKEDNQALIAALKEIREQLSELKMYWWFVADMEEKGLIKRDDYPQDEFIEISPYWRMVETIDKCKLNVILGNPNCIPDCAVKGVPSLIWDRNHVMPFVHDIARKHSLLIPPHSSKDLIRNVLLKLLTDERIYDDFTLDLQEVFRHHTEVEVLNNFNNILNKL